MGAGASAGLNAAISAASEDDLKNSLQLLSEEHVKKLAGAIEIEEPNVFLSLQLTKAAQEQRANWVGKDVPRTSVKVSAPPFNNPQKIDLTSSTTPIDVPVFGPIIPRTAMSIFKATDLCKLAEDIALTIPKDKLNTFVQGKMGKVHEMIKAVREETILAEGQVAAINKLESFTKEFEVLVPADVPDLDAWDAFLRKHVEEGWEQRLHFDSILRNFGFEEEAAAKIRKMEYVWPDGEKVPFEQHALRWLSKAFAAYGPPGAITDIVNMAFAMMSVDTEQIDEGGVAEIVEQFRQKIVSKDFKGLWIPTHFGMDAETDDSLCWLILEYIHRARGSKLHLMVQLPADPIVDEIATIISKTPNCKILRDPDATNVNAVKKYWDFRQCTA
jgi:hypothetical protein